MSRVVTYVGNFEPEFSTENDVRKAFEHLGWQVTCVQENKTHPDLLQHEAFKSNLLLWTGTWDDAQPLKESLDTFYKCAKAGVPTATYHLDIFHGLSRGDRKWWLHPMFHTRHVFTADGDHDAEWEKMAVEHHWLPPAIRHDAAHFGTPRKEYECDVAFVGSNGDGYHEDVWVYRRELIRKLREICQRRGWSFRNPGGEPDKPDMGKISRGEDMNDFYASAKVTVGDSLCLYKEDNTYFSDRVFEAPGRGGFLIMPFIDRLKVMLPPMPMYSWGDWTNLESQVAYYLGHEADRNDKAKRMQEIVANKHTYVNRVEKMLQVMGLS